jgi:perosamine synthetase
MIPLTRPVLGDEETAAVSEVLRSGMLVQGTWVEQFETLVAEHCGREYGVAVSSGTAALYLALQALGIGRGDEVLCPDLTWPSPAHVILQLGAEPVLVDVDPEEWNVTPDRLKAARTPKTRAAIAIDQFGNPVRAREIAAALPDIPLVVDAACSLGSTIDNRPCGGFGNISCISFHPRKVVTTGEGGICLTDNSELADLIRALRNHGQTSAGVFARASGNYRLTNIAASIGIVQMSRLKELVEARQSLARRYLSALPQLSFQSCPENARANYQTFGFLLPEGSSSERRDQLVAALIEQGVQSGVLSYALHRLPPLERSARVAKEARRCFPASSALADRGVALPLYPRMSHADQDRVIEVVSNLLDSI